MAICCAMANSKKLEYSNDDLTVVWQPALCKHTAVCVKTLPKVYNPKAKPWITIENASTEELKAQINQCPSGALSFYKNNFRIPLPGQFFLWGHKNKKGDLICRPFIRIYKFKKLLTDLSVFHLRNLLIK